MWLHITRMLHRHFFETPNSNPLTEDAVFGLAKPYSLRAERWL